MQFLRPLVTSALCMALGAGVGASVKRDDPLPPLQPESVKKAPAVPHVTQLLPKPPPFTSVTASMDWVRKEMRQGNTSAAELLFRSEAGLTLEQQLALAKELVRDFRRHDPRTLARIVLGLPRCQEADHLLWSLISTWSGEDAEGALRFIEALPADRLNTVGVLQNASWGLCRLPAERVLAFAAQLTDKGRSCLAEGLTAFANQAGSWRNSSAILAKLNAKPHEDVYSAERHMGQHLAEIDPQAMESLIAAETDVTKRDEMLKGYAWVIGLNDPVRGIELNGQIVDQRDRHEQIEHHVEQWLTSDRTAALSWLQGDVPETLLSTAERVKLLKSYGLEADR
ncbi:MAG: hypothetical protein IPK22_17500 [Verrucomicrobiaceae bacterium]|nr:hypothetical protein [Verrucomicrobiaceae bacterium]